MTRYQAATSDQMIKTIDRYEVEMSMMRVEMEQLQAANLVLEVLTQLSKLGVPSERLLEKTREITSWYREQGVMPTDVDNAVTIYRGVTGDTDFN